MKKQFGDYRRLARGLVSCSSLWAGLDHLVYVKGNGFLIPFTEDYKRFRYQDILAITMARTRMFAWTSWVYGIGAAASAAIVFLPDYQAPAQVVVATLLLPVLAVCLPGFVITVLRGPSCRCRIETAVGSVVIRPLSRVRQAEPAIRGMKTLILEHQEAIYADAPLLEPAAPAPFAIPLAPPVAPQRVETQRKGAMKFSRFLFPAFAAMIPFGILFLVHAYTLSTWPLVCIGLLSLALFGGLIASLVTQMRCATPGSILTVLWVSIVQQVILIVTAYVVYTIWSFTSQFKGTDTMPFSVAGIYGQARLSRFVYSFSVINGLVSLFLGVAGIALVMRHKSRAALGARPPKLPAPAFDSAEELPGREAGEGAGRREGVEDE